MARDFVAIINDPQRAEFFKSVLGRTEINITSPYPMRADLPGLPRVKVYMVDLDMLTPGERRRLIEATASRFRVPPMVVEQDIAMKGFPILADQCSVAIHNPQRWF